MADSTRSTAKRPECGPRHLETFKKACNARVPAAILLATSPSGAGACFSVFQGCSG